MSEKCQRDPIEIANKIEHSLVQDGKRFFGEFMIEESADKKVLVANAYSCGCNVNCYYCASLMKDYGEGYVPDLNLKYIKEVEFKMGYYSPNELLDRFLAMVGEVKNNPNIYHNREITQFAILDCETTIGMKYIFDFLEELHNYNIANNGKYVFVIFTNGIILGNDTKLIEKLGKYKESVALRFSIKAGNREEFGKRLDINPNYYQCPYRAIEKCIELGMDCQIAVLNDLAIMSAEEFIDIKKQLSWCGYKGSILEEKLVMSRGCVRRIELHKKKYPEYKYRFLFRKNIGIVFKNEKDSDIGKRMRSGIRRVLDEVPQIKAFNDNGDDDILSLIVLTDLNEYSFNDIEEEIKDLHIKYLNVREIIFLHTGSGFIEEIDVSSDDVKVILKNYMSLIEDEIELTKVDAKQHVTAGNRITFYWNKNNE